jgi:hypothetical protein
MRSAMPFEEDAVLFEEGSKSCKFFGVVAAEDFESGTSLLFNHSFPLLEDSESGVGGFVEYAVDPRVVCGFVDKDHKISSIADRDG